MATYQSGAWAALGDPTRKAIFERLADRPRAVGELARELPVSRPAVSQHLKVLKDARLVVDQAVGTRRIYRLDPDGVGALRAELDLFWGKALASYKELVERGTEGDSPQQPPSDQRPSDQRPSDQRHTGPTHTATQDIQRSKKYSERNDMKEDR